MVVNECGSWRRKWGRIHVVPDSELDGSTADHEGHHADRDELLVELTKLGPKVRAAIVLRYFEDLPDAEIAQVLGCRPVTVRGYVHRGLQGAADRAGRTGTQRRPTL